jgi:hypothetical protein
MFGFLTHNAHEFNCGPVRARLDTTAAALSGAAYSIACPSVATIRYAADSGSSLFQVGSRVVARGLGPPATGHVRVYGCGQRGQRAQRKFGKRDGHVHWVGWPRPGRSREGVCPPAASRRSVRQQFPGTARHGTSSASARTAVASRQRDEPSVARDDVLRRCAARLHRARTQPALCPLTTDRATRQ